MVKKLRKALKGFRKGSGVLMAIDVDPHGLSAVSPPEVGHQAHRGVKQGGRLVPGSLDDAVELAGGNHLRSHGNELDAGFVHGLGQVQIIFAKKAAKVNALP